MSDVDVLDHSLMEPVPVAKDPALVNGGADDHDDIPAPPPAMEPMKELNKPVNDMNGVDHGEVNNELDGGDFPVNGDVNGEDELETVSDTEGEVLGVSGDEDDIKDELPPPPEMVGDFLPPPMEPEYPCNDNLEEGTSVDTAGSSSVDCGEGEVVDNVQRIMPDDVSEEDMVSDAGLRDEHEYMGHLLERYPGGQVPLGQLIDFGEPVEPEVIESEETSENEPHEMVGNEPEDMLDDDETELAENDPQEDEETELVENVSESPVPDDGVLVDTSEDGLVPEPVPEPCFEAEQEGELAHHYVPVQEVEPYNAQQDAIMQPKRVTEPVPEIHIEREPEPEPEADVEPDVQEEEPVIDQPQVGLAEPDLVIDTPSHVEPDPEEEAVPPPPPPPLVEETPPPPPQPLDETVQLKRISGEISPTSPTKSPDREMVGVAAAVAPVVVPPVVTPGPEPVRQVVGPPTPVPAVCPPVQQPPTPIQAPQAEVESEDISPPASPSASSGTAEPQDVTCPQVSQKINKKNFKNKIKFGVDLVEAALKQLNFLNNVNKQPTLCEEWLIKKVIRRYEAFWLPMAAEHKKECLAAPIDIEWIWCCHLLAPKAYEADCKSLVGIVVEHKLYTEKDRTKGIEKSRKYWTAKYPKEPFEIGLVYKEKQAEEPASDEPATSTQVTDTVPTNQEPENQEDVVQYADADREPTVEEAAETGASGGGEGETQEATTDDNAQPKTDEKVETKQPEPVPEPEYIVPEEGYVQKSSYDIQSAVARQRIFFYQVSLPHYHDKLFLKTAVKRYQRLIFLKHQHPLEFLVPCYDIDLIWHAHQLHPAAYRKDTTKVLGQILNHDDSVNDRTAGSKLMRADVKTRDLWKTVFDDSFVLYGAMFRGDPPVLCEKMSLIDPKETFAFSTKKATVNLDKVQVEGLPEDVNKYSVKLAQIPFGENEKEGLLIKSFRGNKKKVEFENTKKGLAHFVFDTKEYDRIKFDMHQQIGFACTSHNEELGQQIFNILPEIESIPKDKVETSTIADTVIISEEHNLKTTFSASLETPKQGPTMLYLKNGSFDTRFCIMPEHILQMWGPIPLPRLPTGRDNACIVASHKFSNHTGEVTFTCRLIHSLPLLMSAVQVFYHSRMAAVAHLVGSDQIPLPSQLSDSKKIFSLNPKDGQRAVIIKNQTGDWGIIRGHWTGFRKAVPPVAAREGRKGKKGVLWCPGTLAVSFYKCGTGAWQHMSMPYLQNEYKFCIQDANVDLKSGAIEVNSDSNEVAENLALAFSVSLLHVLCQPRPKPAAPAPRTPPPEMRTPEVRVEELPVVAEAEDTGDGEVQSSPTEGASPDSEPAATEDQPPAEPAVTTPKSPTKSEKSVPATPKKVKEIPPIPSAELWLIVAAGYKVETPTNHYIKRAHGESACAGCVAHGFDGGVGVLGDVQAEVQAEVEIAEAGENVDGEGEMGDGDAAQGEGGDMGDVGAAACGGCGGCGGCCA